MATVTPSMQDVNWLSVAIITQYLASMKMVLIRLICHTRLEFSSKVQLNDGFLLPNKMCEIAAWQANGERGEIPFRPSE